MELKHDWRGFQAVFHPRKRGTSRLDHEADPSSIGSMLYLIVDGKRVVAATGAESEDCASCVGMSVAEVATAMPHRELVLFTREEVDRWMAGCIPLPHLYDQMEYLRSQSVPEAISAHGKVKKIRPVAKRHFLLEGIQGWWSKIFPSSYGLFIRLEEAQGRPSEIFMLIRRGRMEMFHVPDLSSLGAERIRQPEVVVKYLTERHGVPVQGFFVSAEDWAEWSCDGKLDSWREFAYAVKDGRAKMVPFRWQIATLGAGKAFLGI